jgi:hypothetical protein
MSFLEPGKFPLVLDLVVAEVRLTKVLIDGGSGLNLIFASTLRKMGLDFTGMLVSSKSPFYSIIPGNSVHPLGTVVLPVTFGTRDNYRTEFIKFKVANFESSYHAILGRPALAKFMAVPHYVCRYIQTGYLLLGCPGPWRLAIRNLPFCLLGDVAYGPDLTAGTVVSGPSPCYSRTGAPTSPGRLESSRVAPDQGGPGPPRVMAGPSQVRRRRVPSCGGSGAGPAMSLRLEALRGSPAHQPAFNVVAGPGAPKSKRAACC